MVAQTVDQAFSFVGNVFAVDLLNTDGLARGVLGTDVERQVARLAAISDLLLRGIEVALAEAVFFEKVAVVAAADGEILSEFAG